MNEKRPRDPPWTQSNGGNNRKRQDRTWKHVDERMKERERGTPVGVIIQQTNTRVTAEEGQGVCLKKQQVETSCSRERYSQTAKISNRFNSI